MPIQIDQRMPRCRRCGKLVHERAAGRIVEAGGALYCSAICRDEYVAIQAGGAPPSPARDGAR